MSQNSRGKGDKGSTSDVSFARNKLDGVLQTLMDKTGDSSEPSDDDDPLYEGDTYKDSNASTRASSKRSLGGKTPRKRKRKEEDNIRELNNGNSTYVMKLFDRNVDLAKFNESTALYPIARAWVYNDPYSGSNRTRFMPPAVDDEITPDEEQEEGKQNVYELPSPIAIKSEVGHKPQNIRIPTCPIPHVEKLETLTVDPSAPPTRAVLLANNMARWKQVRHSWKEASMANEVRYKDSLAVLKSLKVVYE
ncbi:Lin-37 [Chamberlinius hualienensis]